MNKVLKFGLYFGVTASLAGCGTSEHFMQDDVYNTRTPIMPPGTDLNDITDYATFVAKKEQTEVPAEQTAYVSPMQYNDFFYRSQFVYYGYSPYAPVTGISYFGYGNYFRPVYGYSSNGMGIMYPYGYSSAYYANPYMLGYGYSSYGTASWYTPISKPNTSKTLASSHAGTSAGRMGSSNSGVVSYQNKMIAKPGSQRFSGAGRNTTVNASPVVSSPSPNGRNTNLQARTTARPVITGRPSTSGSTATQRTSTNRTVVTNPNTGSGRTFTNSSGTRTSTPSVRSSGGSSGGSVSTPSSGGGSRSGGRR